MVFSPLAQGMLSDKYLRGIPAGSRAAKPHGALRPEAITAERVAQLGHLNDIARGRGQSLAQLALQWVLRDRVVASALIGASRPEQLDENLAALEGPEFTVEELERIDALSDGIDVDLWAESAQR